MTKDMKFLIATVLMLVLTLIISITSCMYAYDAKENACEYYEQTTGKDC